MDQNPNATYTVTTPTAPQKGNTKVLFICIIIGLILSIGLNIYALFRPAAVWTSEDIEIEEKMLLKKRQDLAKDFVVVTNTRIEKETYSSKIYAQIENKSDIMLDISIYFTCYNEAGEYLDTVTILCSYVPAGSKFLSESYVSDDADSYDIISIQANPSRI